MKDMLVFVVVYVAVIAWPYFANGLYLIAESAAKLLKRIKPV